jgi:hypothetical protein
LTSARTVGVVSLRGDARHLEDPVQRRLVEAFAGQTALALERAQLAEQAQRARVEIEAEQLRTALLSSLSHDLRTPLGAITGAATSLLEHGGEVEPAARRELLETVRGESRRMNRLIGNLLDMVRLEAGALEAQREWQSLEEPVAGALMRLADVLKDRRVDVKLPPDLPLVPVDASAEQVFVNGSTAGTRLPGPSAVSPCPDGEVLVGSPTAAGIGGRGERLRVLPAPGSAGVGGGALASRSAAASSRRTAAGCGPSGAREGGVPLLLIGEAAVVEAGGRGRARGTPPDRRRAPDAALTGAS